MLDTTPKKSSEIVSLIGRGTFSRAYLRRDGRVLLKSDDPMKEAMALGFFPRSRLFPRIERIASTSQPCAQSAWSRRSGATCAPH